MGMALCAVPVFAQPQLSKDNVDEVLAAMTLEEKATLVIGAGWGNMAPGSLTASDAVLCPGAAGTTQAIPRLGIPKTVLADGPAGLRIHATRPGTDRTFYCTGFPVGEVLACSWDVNLVKEVTSAMGNEVLEYGADVLLAPGMNIHRNPLCGRNFEYFSEDPVLSGKIASAYVQGIQSQNVGTSIKHYAANNQEINRMNNDAIVSERALREIYLKNFEIAVKESDPWTVMSSYNRLNGPYTQEDHDLLTKVLRDDWGFRGIVMTDWTGQRNTVAQIMAGNDLMEPGQTSQTKELIEAVNSGKLDVKDLDVCVKRILQYIVRTPRFQGYKYSDQPDLKAHAAVARTGATEGMVLLKNRSNALPVEGGKVALFGVGSYETVAGGTGSGNVNKAYVISLKEGLEAAGFTLVPELANLYETHIAFDHNRQNAEKTPSAWDFLGTPMATELALSKKCIDSNAARADFAIFTIRRNAGEGDDRRVENDFNLTADETRMLNQVSNAFHAQGKKVIVVMNVGGVIETASWVGLADAVLLAWSPGQEAGHAIADLLTGKVNPSGKLSMTFPVAFMDHPSSANFPYEGQGAGGFGYGPKQPRKDIDYTNYSEGIWVGYRWFDKAPEAVMYPFGYGLSYTTFAYSKPVLQPNRDGGFTARITVTNTGKVAGKESVQLYVSAPAGGMEKPVKELKAFAKTSLLQPGQSQTLSFTVEAYDLASFNEEASQWETAAGTYKVQFAASAADIRETAVHKIGKAKTYNVSAHACAPKK